MTKPAQITINAEKCLRDGICTEVCPCNIFRPDENGLAHINPDNAALCIRCGHCVAACPSSAISLNGVSGEQLEAAPTKPPTFAELSGLVKSRRSIRSYKPETIDTDELARLFDLIRWVPTAKNAQALSWIVLNGKEKVLKLSEAVIDVFRADDRMSGMVAAFETGHDVIHRGAPHVAIAYGPEKYSWGTLDAAVAVGTLELAAKASGYATCWGGFTTRAASLSKSIAHSLEIADDQKIFAVVMLGKANFRYFRIPQRDEQRLKFI
jgi:nitroreductase/NAD-dependent dihydropyrimidine dehydrogenase PreA subunit